MAKPEKQQASGVSVLLDGVNAKRIQRISVNADIPQDQERELANSGVVQYISDAPTVTVQIDSNDVGSTDLMALVTDSLIDYSIADEADGPLGGLMRNYIKADSSNGASVDQDDFLNGYCSLLMTFNEDGTTAKRAMWVNHCAVTSFNFSYDVDGSFAENYTLTADNQTWFLNDLADIRCYKPVFNQIGYNDNGLEISNLASCIPGNSSVVAMGVNNTILRNHNYGGVSGNATFTQVTADAFVATSDGLSTPWASTVSGSTDRIWIIYKTPFTSGNTWEATSNATAPGWELESSAGSIGALRRGYMSAYLYNTNSDSLDTYTKAGRALRIQSISIDGALGEDKLYELGTDGFYGIAKQTPVPITVNTTVNDSDLQYFAMLTSTAYDDSNVKSLSVSDFNGYNALRIDIYKDKAKTTLLKTITIDKMYVQSNNFNVSVGENATHEIAFSTDNITSAGSGTNVIGGPNYA